MARNRPTAEPKERVDGDTSKSKPSLAKKGLAPLVELEMSSIIWAPIVVDSEMRRLLLDVLSVRDSKENPQYLDVLTALLLTPHLQTLRPELEKETEAIIHKMAEDSSEEDLQNQILKLQRQQEKILLAIEKKKESSSTP